MAEDKTPTDDLTISLEGGETPTGAGAPRLLLSAGALAEMREHGATDTTRECGGVMIGQKLEGEAGPLVLVEAVIAGMYTDQQRGSVTFTHETWEQINEEKDQKYPGLRIVGWYHTHPGFGIFLSEYDKFIQRNFFNLPWNVAFVLDPRSGETGAFGWQEDQIVRLPNYEVFGDGKEATDTGETPVPPGPEPAGAEPAILTQRVREQRSHPLAAVLLILLLALSALNLGQITRMRIDMAKQRAEQTTAPAKAPAVTPLPMPSLTGEAAAGPATAESAGTPATGEAQAGAPEAESYVVQKGDTWASIAERKYGKADLGPWLAEVNGPWKHGPVLTPGWTVHLPPAPKGEALSGGGTHR